MECEGIITHYASFHGDAPSIEYLFSLGIDREAKNDKGETAKDVANVDVLSYF